VIGVNGPEHMQDVIYSTFASPIGDLVMTMRDDSLVGLYFPIGKDGRKLDARWRRHDRPFASVRKQLTEYFTGKRRDFELDLSMSGTDFQQTVWAELRRIPYGETISYAQLAHRVGNPAASRAVGSANGKNPIPIIVPCHRVIASGGKLGGFGGGLDTKQWLLDHEASRV
jgi:methylated-DNA-[protein]-cysteine S-methyltransferase